MASDDLLELDGKVTKILPGSKFEVEIETKDGDSKYVIATIGGKLRKFKINIILGDKVTVAVSPYDLTKGIIRWRHK